MFQLLRQNRLASNASQFRDSKLINRKTFTAFLIQIGSYVFFFLRKAAMFVFNIVFD